MLKPQQLCLVASALLDLRTLGILTFVQGQYAYSA